MDDEHVSATDSSDEEEVRIITKKQKKENDFASLSLRYIFLSRLGIGSTKLSETLELLDSCIEAPKDVSSNEEVSFETLELYIASDIVDAMKDMSPDVIYANYKKYSEKCKEYEDAGKSSQPYHDYDDAGIELINFAETALELFQKIKKSPKRDNLIRQTEKIIKESQ